MEAIVSMAFRTHKETVTMGSSLANAEQLEARSVASKMASPSEHLSRIVVAGVMLILPNIVIGRFGMSARIFT
jgi:hypothetical protein